MGFAATFLCRLVYFLAGPALILMALVYFGSSVGKFFTWCDERRSPFDRSYGNRHSHQPQERRTPTPFFSNQSSRSAANTIQKGNDKITITMDIPGVRKEHLKVQIDAEKYLTVEGKRGSVPFSRRVFLNDDSILKGKIHANLLNGVLTITMGKKEKPAPIKIAISEEPIPPAGEVASNDSKKQEKATSEEGGAESEFVDVTTETV